MKFLVRPVSKSVSRPVSGINKGIAPDPDPIPDPIAPSGPTISIAEDGQNLILNYNWQGSDGGSPISTHKLYLYKNNVLISTYVILESQLPYQISVLNSGTGTYKLTGEVKNEFGLCGVAETSIEFVFKIDYLFQSGEQGAFYDISSINTLYQDNAGTVPISISGQTNGLVLDKSFGLALDTTNRIVNSEFNGLDNWQRYGAPIVETKDNQLIVKNNGGAAGVWQSIQTNGDFVKFTCKVKIEKLDNWTADESQNIICYSSGGLIAVNQLTRAPISNTEFVEFTCFLKSSTADKKVAIYFQNLRNNGVLIIKEPKAFEMKGNHASEPLSQKRPIYRSNPARLVFDNVDDQLTANFLSPLSNCTVVRAVANVGTQILTGQSIPANHIENKDFSGLLIVNRALTQLETEEVTRIFNRLAGV